MIGTLDVAPLRAQDEREYALKAGFLYHFAQFVTWPPAAFADTTTPFVIGVHGDASVVRVVRSAVAGGNVNGRPVQVRRIDSDKDLTPCHILFVAGADPRERERVTQLVTAAPVLTVADASGTPGSGAMVTFRIEGNRLRFDVDARSARRAGLDPGSQLLLRARRVAE